MSNIFIGVVNANNGLTQIHKTIIRILMHKIGHQILISTFHNNYPNNKTNPTAKAATDIPIVM